MGGDTPFADHVAHACVTSCPAGSAPLENKDCAVCAATAPYSDHRRHVCVDKCPEEFRAGPNAQNACELCTGNFPYFDIASDKCVVVCPTGMAPNATKFCVD